jgi:hypothetical protein
MVYNKIKQIIRLYSTPKFVLLNKFIKNYPKDKIKVLDTSGEKLPPYLRLPEKAIAYSVAIKVSK